MKKTMPVKRIVDVLMLVLLLVLMDFQYTGTPTHEWTGAAMFLAVFAHQFLNRKWYQSLAKGRYTPIRLLQTAITLLLLADMLVMMVTGILMSGTVFAWLPVHGGAFVARRFHLAGAHWGFLLMAMHMGLHFGMMAPMWNKLQAKPQGTKILGVLRVVEVLAVFYGLYAFIGQGIASYLFFRTEFYQWGTAENVWMFTLQNLCMLFAFAVLADFLRRAAAIQISSAYPKTPKSELMMGAQNNTIRDKKHTTVNKEN